MLQSNNHQEHKSQKTFVITGGRGFIGSHFVEKCLNEGHKVIDIDCITYCASKILPWDMHENYTLIKENITKLTHIPICDIVVNFAAESHVDNSIIAPDIFFNTNTIGTINLLNLLRGKLYKVPTLVHISTDEVYGDSIECTKTESDTLNPSNPYAASKAAAEMAILSYSRTYNIPYQIIRSTNNYGPRQYPEKLIPIIIKCIEEKIKIPLHGDGTYIRDWLYVEDNIDAIYRVCFSENKNEIWNVSAYNYKTNNQIVEEIGKWFKIDDILSHINYIENRIGQDYRYSISSEKIRSILGWKPIYQGVLKNITE